MAASRINWSLVLENLVYIVQTELSGLLEKNGPTAKGLKQNVKELVKESIDKEIPLTPELIEKFLPEKFYPHHKTAAIELTNALVPLVQLAWFAKKYPDSGLLDSVEDPLQEFSDIIWGSEKPKQPKRLSLKDRLSLLERQELSKNIAINLKNLDLVAKLKEIQQSLLEGDVATLEKLHSYLNAALEYKALQPIPENIQAHAKTISKAREEQRDLTQTEYKDITRDALLWQAELRGQRGHLLVPSIVKISAELYKQKKEQAKESERKSP